jgi:hypothetical protein
VSRTKKVFLINNLAQVVLEFSSIKEMKEWAKKHNDKIKQSPLTDNWYYTEDFSVIPPCYPDVLD